MADQAPKPGDWMESAQTLANIGHALGGYAVLLTPALFSLNTLMPVGIVAALLVVYVLVKEFWYDLRYETGETWASSAEDAAGYAIGMVVAAIVIAVAYLVRSA